MVKAHGLLAPLVPQLLAVAEQITSLTRQQWGVASMRDQLTPVPSFRSGRIHHRRVPSGERVLGIRNAWGNKYKGVAKKHTSLKQSVLEEVPWRSLSCQKVCQTSQTLACVDKAARGVDEPAGSPRSKGAIPPVTAGVCIRQCGGKTPAVFGIVQPNSRNGTRRVAR
jgi:hypothetical protein